MAKGLLAGVVFGVLVAVLILAVAALQLESRKPVIVMVAPEVLPILGAEPAVRDRQGAVSGQQGWGASSADDVAMTVVARMGDLPEASNLPVFAPLPEASDLQPPMAAPEIASAPEVPATDSNAQSLDVLSLGLSSQAVWAGGEVRLPVLLSEAAQAQVRPEVLEQPAHGPVLMPVETGRNSLALPVIQTPREAFVRLAARPEASGPVTGGRSPSLGVIDTRPARPNVPDLPPQLDITAPDIGATRTPVLALNDPSTGRVGLDARIADPETMDRRISAPLAAPLVTPKPADIAAPPSITGLISGGGLAGAKSIPEAVNDVAEGRPVMAIVLDRQGDAPVGLPAWTRSIIVPAVALSGDASTVPEGAEILPKIREAADRGALSALAWDIARHPGHIGPLYSTTGLANEQAKSDLLGLLRAADIGLVLGGDGLPLLEPANTAGISVASGYPVLLNASDQVLGDRLDRAVTHAKRDGAVIVIVRDSTDNRAAIRAWLDTEPGIMVVSVAQALNRLRADR